MRVASLTRYPVKSMLGEAVESTEIGSCGLPGDRRLAVVDRETGLVASAKQPRKWAALLQCRANVDDAGGTSITMPDGATLPSDDARIDDVLSAYCGRAVTLSATPPPKPRLERWWPDVDGLAPADVIERAGSVTPFAAAAEGTFFDYAPVHVVTTSSLRALRAAHPRSTFDAQRFRPNIVLETSGDGFIENGWGGGQIAVGPVVLDVLTPTPRCAVPSLAHGTLPGDLGVLRGVVAANRIRLGGGNFACVGVYANVISPGKISLGDAARLL